MIKKKVQNIKSSHQANLENQGSDNMKQGWEIKKLGEVCEMYQPKTISTKEMVDDGQYPVFGANGIIGKYDKYNHEEPQLLITCRGATCGSVNISEPKSWINGNAMVVRPKDHTIDLKFLEYLFRGGVDLSRTITGAAQPQITRQSLNPIEISYPKSLHEQQRIVSILDKAFAAIEKAKANAEQNLKNAKELFESYLQEVFDPSTRSGQGKKGDGWEVRTLGELCVFTQGIQRDVKLQSETKGENQVRFLRIVDYTQGNEPPRYIDFPGEKYILNTDDVALVRYGASTGFVCRGLEGALANNLFRVIPKSTGKLTNDFLFIFLRSPLFQNAIKATMNGAAMPAISFSLIEGIPFPLPPLEEQQTIVRQLDALRAETQKLEALYQKKIDNLEELKKSILQKAFSGEL
ncbi:restriction endonuclease subunit S [Sphingobacterium sp. T2]|uniref:restriction endonuclease subunit S n=1 Tax=Sphingobacterium sp. T2 TaxID=1590596 RepID=UPI000B238E36|nr:restriction endonuclease subunit S [Sphingobacterium sp. T2]